MHDTRATQFATSAPRLSGRAVSLILLAGLTSISAFGAWVMFHSLVRPSQGKLVALQSAAVWKSPPIRTGAPRFRAEAQFSLVNRGGA